ncbi:MAG: DUF6273 domain-containing protein, partial [Propionibacteriaceae bacterium]|nr:DUF6273 domain-containing protein [Propionibacteriaceae bacterium]
LVDALAAATTSTDRAKSQAAFRKFREMLAEATRSALKLEEGADLPFSLEVDTSRGAPEGRVCWFAGERLGLAAQKLERRSALATRGRADEQTVEPMVADRRARTVYVDWSGDGKYQDLRAEFCRDLRTALANETEYDIAVVQRDGCPDGCQHESWREEQAGSADVVVCLLDATCLVEAPDWLIDLFDADHAVWVRFGYVPEGAGTLAAEARLRGRIDPPDPYVGLSVDGREKAVQGVAGRVVAVLDRPPRPTLPRPAASPPGKAKVERRAQRVRPLLPEGYQAVEQEAEEREGLGPDTMPTLDDAVAVVAEGARVSAVQRLVAWATGSAERRYCALLGDSGMGKTTTCRLFGQALLRLREAGEAAPLPLYFDLRDVRIGPDGLAPSNVDRVFADILEADHALDKVTLSDLQEVLRTEDCVVIFDGLDEVLTRIGPHEGQRFARLLWRWVEERLAAGEDQPAEPDLRVLLACRTHYYRNLSHETTHFTDADRDGPRRNAFLVLTMLPFSLKQIRTYVARNLSLGQAQKFMSAIKAIHDVRGLAQRPVTLRWLTEDADFMAAAAVEGGTVTAVDLYRRLVRSSLSRDEPKHRFVGEHKVELMEELAAAMWRDQATAWSARKLEDWAIDLLERRPDIDRRYRGRIDLDILLEDLRTATFLRRDRTDRFTFAHTSWQEFFLSEYLLHALEDNAPERWRLRTPSDETLDFLGQSLAETGGSRRLATMARWFRGQDRAVNSVILGYRRLASWEAWPQAELPLQCVDQGATSDIITPGEKVLLGGNVWRVLDVCPQVGTALLLSDHLVAYRAYHHASRSVVWQNCSLRKWLNEEFFQSLPADFTEMIVETDNENPRGGSRPSGGPAMWDKVYILSPQEARRYLKKDDDTTKVATRHDGQRWPWWLRSPGGVGYYAAFVGMDGLVYDLGDPVHDAACGVRPALTIRIPRS